MKDWNAAPILSARNLTRRYGEHIGCRDVSFDLWPGEVLGIVGESGSGKSMAALAVMGLIPSPPGSVSGGSIRFRGRELVGMDEEERRRIRGKDIA